ADALLPAAGADGAGTAGRLLRGDDQAQAAARRHQLDGAPGLRAGRALSMRPVMAGAGGRHAVTTSATTPLRRAFVEPRRTAPPQPAGWISLGRQLLSKKGSSGL